jgi:hypothetical protein
MPPPAATVVSVDQLAAPAPDEEPAEEPDEELDEHPATSSATAANPASANLYGDLTNAS